MRRMLTVSFPRTTATSYFSGDEETGSFLEETKRFLSCCREVEKAQSHDHVHVCLVRKGAGKVENKHVKSEFKEHCCSATSTCVGGTYKPDSAAIKGEFVSVDIRMRNCCYPHIRWHHFRMVDQRQRETFPPF